ncbi:Aste57867_23494 [Aphanomyces stellatus]|uniref:Aste57867_23494 protein n=1 Tax=Aphanomyces stellatus TaxID=120398 RepID=A0A485LNW2_9STRA|nr:hypothetical protein As57867_023423 [Aphanomyces stellatus]VFU00139.1 Aste57867_23494 [Aphanomyces stellatus]
MAARAFYNVGYHMSLRATHPAKHVLNAEGFAQPHVWKARVGLLEVGLNGHMEKSVLMNSVDLARWSTIALNGTLGLALRHKWFFRVGANMVTYHEPIPLLRPYEVQSEVVYWDDEGWLYFDHRIVCPVTGTLYADAISRNIIKRTRKATIEFPEMLEILGLARTRPPMPDVIRHYLAWDSATKQSMEAWSDSLVQQPDDVVTENVSSDGLKFNVVGK